MDIQERRDKVGDEPTETKKYYMATCPDCGGRGHHTDDEKISTRATGATGLVKSIS